MRSRVAGATVSVPKVRRRDAELFVEDETEVFRDAVRAGKMPEVKQMLQEVSESRTWLGFGWLISAVTGSMC